MAGIVFPFATIKAGINVFAYLLLVYTSMSLKMSNLAEIVHKANAGFDTFTASWGEIQQQNTEYIQKLQQELQQLLDSQKDKDTTDKGNNENDDNSTKQST